jgi:Zn-dependent peptidase ImmA (M78 family)
LSNFPEINFARRLVAIRKLHPPVDVVALASKYADLEVNRIPFDVDGISLNLKVSGKRPHIILNASAPQTRQRFTLAHEIGHIIIPWHFGTILDETDPIEPVSGNAYRELEGEANRFASELLMPSKWALKIIEEEPEPPHFVRRIESEANVSPLAAAIRIIGLLPKGYIFCNFTDEGIVLFSGRSDDTLANAPTWGISQNPETLYPYCTSRWTFRVHGQQFWWWKLPKLIPIPRDRDPRDWRSVLDHILDDLKISLPKKQSLKQTISGVVGYANSAVRGLSRSENSVFTACIERLQSKEQLQGFVNHPEFEIFLKKRVHDFFIDAERQ